MKTNNLNDCPLCSSPSSVFDEFELKVEKRIWPRIYNECNVCGMVFLLRDLLLSKADEKSRYSVHDNSDTPEYRSFLDLLWQPLRARLSVDVEGLDFGCGPNPVLAKMIQECGYNCDKYDPYFSPKEEVFTKVFDFLVCTEVIEHMTSPRKEFDRWKSMVSSEGYIGLMTDKLAPNQSFRDWHYIRDLTHINFYRKETFEWVAEHYHWDLLENSERVSIFRVR